MMEQVVLDSFWYTGLLIWSLFATAIVIAVCVMMVIAAFRLYRRSKEWMALKLLIDKKERKMLRLACQKAKNDWPVSHKDFIAWLREVQKEYDKEFIKYKQ